MNHEWQQFIHVRSPRFAPMPGEDEELVNDGMYGKALSLFLQEKLAERGYSVPDFVCEDWGWWVEVKRDELKTAIGIYCGLGSDGSQEYACTILFTGIKKLPWKKINDEEVFARYARLFIDLKSLFEGDAEVEFVGLSEECPVGENN